MVLDFGYGYSVIWYNCCLFLVLKAALQYMLFINNLSVLIFCGSTNSHPYVIVEILNI